jgi:drug/metabolite transporter (DMT)-like permease
MLPANILGIVLALTSAAVWGGGDFTGGYASRRSSPLHVLALAALSGLLILIVTAVIGRETFPSARGMLIAALGGISGALGIAAFYRALTMGHVAAVAPTSGVISAILPVVVGIFTQGLPDPSKLIGFGLALAGIWLVSAASASEGRMSSREVVLAILAGIGFGGFLTFLGLVDPGKIFTPLIISRSMTLCIGLLLIKLNRMPLPALTSNPAALLAGVLDAGGNLLYIMSRQFTRLDIAALLSSLYPASTVILAGIILKEKISFRQGIGVVICLAAIVLIVK